MLHFERLCLAINHNGFCAEPNPSGFMGIAIMFGHHLCVCVYRCGGGLVYTVKSSKSELNSNTSFTESIECNLSETVNRTGIQYNHTRVSQFLAGPTKCRA